MFWHKWKISSTFIRCQKFSGREKFPEMPKIFEHRDLSRVLCPKLWAEMKILNPYNLPRQLTNSKNAQNFWSVLEKKFSWIFFSTKIFWLPILFSRNEKKFNLYNLRKIWGNIKIPKLPKCFQGLGRSRCNPTQKLDKN